MTKLEIRKQSIDRHYRRLEHLARNCGVSNPNGKKLSLALWKLEHLAHRAAEDYCNGVSFHDEDSWDAFCSDITEQVQSLFNHKLAGFFVNADARGHALKINNVSMGLPLYAGVNLERDWGGYGILSPTIE